MNIAGTRHSLKFNQGPRAQTFQSMSKNLRDSSIELISVIQSDIRKEATRISQFKSIQTKFHSAVMIQTYFKTQKQPQPEPLHKSVHSQLLIWTTASNSVGEHRLQHSGQQEPLSCKHHLAMKEQKQSKSKLILKAIH